MKPARRRLTCQTRRTVHPPAQTVDTAHDHGRRGAKTLQITLTWTARSTKFKSAGLALVGKDGLLAVASRPTAFAGQG